MNFEKELKSLIKDKYKTIGAFAREINIPYSTVNNIFQRDIMGVSIQVVLKICQELNIDIDEIRNDKLVFKHNIRNIADFSLYEQLDTEDKAEIRGEMKQMLKADKYSNSKTSYNSKIIDVGRAAAHGGESAKLEITEETAKRIRNIRDKLNDDE